MTFLERLLADPARTARIRRGFYAALFLVALLEIVLPLAFPPEGHHFAFEGFPAWGSLYGLFSCVAIIVVSKLIGKAFLMRPEDHYDD